MRLNILKYNVEYFINCSGVPEQSTYILHIISFHLEQEKLNILIGIISQYTAENKGPFTH